MNEEILRIQKMVAEGKVSPEESLELISSVLAAAPSRSQVVAVPANRTAAARWSFWLLALAAGLCLVAVSGVGAVAQRALLLLALPVMVGCYAAGRLALGNKTAVQRMGGGTRIIALLGGAAGVLAAVVAVGYGLYWLLTYVVDHTLAHSAAFGWTGEAYALDLVKYVTTATWFAAVAATLGLAALALRILPGATRWALAPLAGLAKPIRARWPVVPALLASIIASISLGLYIESRRQRTDDPVDFLAHAGYGYTITIRHWQGPGGRAAGAPFYDRAALVAPQYRYDYERRDDEHQVVVVLTIEEFRAWLAGLERNGTKLIRGYPSEESTPSGLPPDEYILEVNNYRSYYAWLGDDPRTIRKLATGLGPKGCAAIDKIADALAAIQLYQDQLRRLGQDAELIKGGQSEMFEIWQVYNPSRYPSTEKVVSLWHKFRAAFVENRHEFPMTFDLPGPPDKMSPDEYLGFYAQEGSSGANHEIRKTPAGRFAFSNYPALATDQGILFTLGRLDDRLELHLVTRIGGRYMILQLRSKEKPTMLNKVSPRQRDMLADLQKRFDNSLATKDLTDSARSAIQQRLRLFERSYLEWTDLMGRPFPIMTGQERLRRDECLGTYAVKDQPGGTIEVASDSFDRLLVRMEGRDLPAIFTAESVVFTAGDVVGSTNPVSKAESYGLQVPVLIRSQGRFFLLKSGMGLIELEKLPPK